MIPEPGLRRLKQAGIIYTVCFMELQKWPLYMWNIVQKINKSATMISGSIFLRSKHSTVFITNCLIAFTCMYYKCTCIWKQIENYFIFVTETVVVNKKLKDDESSRSNVF